MARMLTVCALLLATTVVRAEDPPMRTIITLEVSPARAPKPALRYAILPELKGMNPGNPVQGYMKCFMEQNNFFFSRTSVENQEKWQTMSLKELPVKDLRNYGGSALKQADDAARLDMPDWQILLKLKNEGLHLLLPEVQQMRRLASALKVRFRAEVAEQRFDDALFTAQTMFALARHMGEHPTLIGDLVGIAIAFVGIGPLEELIAQPGSPNLYWALSVLPSPFIDLRKGMQGERTFLAAEMDFFGRTTPLSEAQLEEAVRRLDALVTESIQFLTLGFKPPGKPVARQSYRELLQARAKDKEYLAKARERLAESGLSRETLKKLPALQVVLLDEKRAFEVKRDEAMKWTAFSLWQEEASRSRTPAGEEGDQVLPKIAPATDGVRRAQARLDQRIALLRHVEALRMYAAEHGGKFPASLADISVPLPVDPVTGKPFAYQVEGGKAVLRGSPPRGQEKIAGYNVQYELTLRK